MELIEVVSERMKALLEAYDYSQYMIHDPELQGNGCAPEHAV